MGVFYIRFQTYILFFKLIFELKIASQLLILCDLSVLCVEYGLILLDFRLPVLNFCDDFYCIDIG